MRSWEGHPALRQRWWHGASQARSLILGLALACLSVSAPVSSGEDTHKMTCHDDWGAPQVGLQSRRPFLSGFPSQGAAPVPHTPPPVVEVGPVTQARPQDPHLGQVAVHTWG